MKTINIIKILGIIGLLFLLPSISNAQIQRVWSIAEYTSTMLPPPATGTKVAYRTLNNSLYYWNGSAWIRIAGPGIVDTSYSLSFSSPNLSLLGSGSSVSLTNLYTPGWGLLKTAEEFKVDSSKVASRYYAGTNPTSIANNYVATSNGSNLVARNLFDNNAYVGILNSKPFLLGQWTTAGRPAGVNGQKGFNTTFNWEETYITSTWVRSMQAHGNPTLAGNAIAYGNSSTGRIDGSNIFQYNATTQQLGIYGVGFAGNYIEISRSNGSSKPQLLFFTTGAGAGTIQYGSTAGNLAWDISNNVNVAGFIAAGTKLNGNSVSVGNNSYPISNGSMTIIPPVGSPGFINFTEPGINYMGNLGVYQTSGDLIWETVPTQANQFGTGTQRFRVNRSTGNFGIGIGATINYSLEQLSKTDAFGVARGTVAQRPTVASSTTPIRYNTDSTMLEYGESAGTWRQLASRAYVRTVSNNNAWLGTRLVAGDVTINAPYTSVLKINQDTGFWSLRRGVMFMGSPDKDTTGNDRTPSIFIMPNEADSTAAYMRASSSVWIGSRLGANEHPPEGSVTIGYLNTNKSLSGSYFSNVIGFLNEARGTINTNIYGQDCLVTKNDAQAYGFNVDLTGFSGLGIGRNISISGDYSLGIGRDITSIISNRYTYGRGNSDEITHQMNGSLIVGRDSSLKFNQTAKTLQLSAYGTGTKEAADLSKTQSNYIAGFATDGTVLSRTVASVQDGNGIYTGSGTIANHTTRALIPSTGNLLFSQTYNTTDSAYIQVINNLDGNREIRGGLTDTASTGFSKFRFYQDEANEEMGWEILTSDGTGTTAIGGQGGNLSLYADAAGTVEVRGQELRLNNGEVSMNQYGQGNMKASDVSATDSKFVAKFGDAGKVLDYYLARDTFIEDATLFSVGTLMNDCQELTVVSSMTATAPSHQEIRFPDAGDHLRGKKIIVYQKKKEAGIYVPQIKVVGGVSRLYFTTTPGIGGTDPSDQSTLSIDDSTWSSHGTTFEFTCLKIDNTPSYRWVLKQR